MAGWPEYPPVSAINGPWGEPSAPVNAGDQVRPPAPVVVEAVRKPSPRLKLETVQNVRRELARIYREARRGELKAETATKLAYLLDLMARMIERSDLERRIEQLESGGK